MSLMNNPFTPAPVVKAMINIGALFDIPTGFPVVGINGEWIWNGGVAPLTGVVGIGNNFKTTIMRFMSLTSCSRMVIRNFKDGEDLASTGSTYDTEVNTHEKRVADLAGRIEEFHGEDILDTGRWVVTDKTVYSGTEWYKAYREFLDGKIKNPKYVIKTPFWNRDRTGPMEIIMPTFTEMDSFTEFETDDVEAMQVKAELGDSSGNMIHQRQGLAKLRFLMQAPGLNGRSMDYLFMTAHIGKESTLMNTGPGGQVPIVKNIHLKNGDKIKGTTDKFTFITHNCWHCFNAKPMINDGTKGPEYPRDADDNLKLDTDLMLVLVKQLRGKSGPSGMPMQIIVSQSEGVLPSLTEFHHIKEYERYGLEGSNISYSLAIYPDCKLQRTTVRGKIEEDALLRRALTITSEMCQLSYLNHDLDEKLLCTPKQLYDDLKKLGYDWNVLLATRGWWSPDPKHPVPFLSTMDLLKMRVGEYHPYWMEPKNDKQKAARQFVLDKQAQDTREIQIKRGLIKA
jgi:hypothetical protein